MRAALWVKLRSVAKLGCSNAFRSRSGGLWSRFPLFFVFFPGVLEGFLWFWKVFLKVFLGFWKVFCGFPRVLEGFPGILEGFPGVLEGFPKVLEDFLVFLEGFAL